MSDTTAPTATIEALSAVANVVAMRITWSEAVSGFAVGDLTISVGGSLASFATADNITFTVSWTLAAGANTMDIAGSVCTDAAGNNNTAATQFTITYLVIQPAAAAGADAFIYSAGATTNYGTDAAIAAGLDLSGTLRSLLKFDLSTVPAASSVLSAWLSLYEYSESASQATTVEVFRLKRAWVEAQATWNIYSTGNNWQTAGGFGANDCEQTNIGSRAESATETLNEFKIYTLTASKVQEWTSGAFANNGMLLKANPEASTTDHYWRSSDHGTAGQRPKFEAVYYPS